LSDDPLFFSLNGGFVPNVSMDNAGNAVTAFQTINQGGSGRFNNTFDIAVERTNSGGFNTGYAFGTTTGIGFDTPPFPSQVPDIALDPNGTGMFVVSFETQLLGATQGNRTVQLDEVSGSNAIIGVANLAAFPDNTQPTATLPA